MKKLFFTALVAVVAIGGAYAQSATHSTGPNSTGTKFYCSGTQAPLCSSLSGAYIIGTSTWVQDLPEQTIREVK